MENNHQCLSQRIRDCLVWVAEQYTINLHDFAEIMNNHPQTKRPITYDGARKSIARLRASGYVGSKRIVRSLPSFIYVTAKALDELHIPFPEYEPRHYERHTDGRATGETIWHTDSINKVRIFLEQRYGPQLGWISERRLRHENRLHPETVSHRADALAFVEGKNTSIEVENTDKGPERLEGILLDHMLRYDQTYYFCTNPGTYGLVKRKALELDPDLTHFHILSWSTITA